MLIRWGDIDSAFSMLNEFRRQMNQWPDTNSSPLYGDDPGTTEWSRGWPRMQLVDQGAELLLRAEVPGLSEQDIDVSINQDVLTVSGERKAEVPEGYKVHRHERASVKFSRSFALPTKVDLERTSAVAKNGVLTVRLPKAPEVKPRQIAVKGV